MFQIREKPVHRFMARIPELDNVLLKDTSTNKLALWRESRGITLRAIRLQGVDLEFVRDVDAAYRVIDNDYNRSHCPHEIGRVYVDSAPIGANIREL